MTGPRDRGHWESIWTSAPHERRSWFQHEPQPSLDLVGRHTPAGGHVVDAGGGASPLVDRLVQRGHRVTVVDISDAALDLARDRLGARAADVTWLCADVTTVALDAPCDTWHDRAVLHFLTDEADRAAYVEAVRRTLRLGGHVVVGSFARGGPERCSDLPVRQHDAEDLVGLFGDGFTLVEQQQVLHPTPSGAGQDFTFVVLRHRG